MIRTLLLSASLILPTVVHAQDDVTIALDWVLNTNHVGLVVARDRGLYEEAGMNVEILPYSDTSSTALLAAGVADFAYMTSLGFMSARAAGADITALWATMQHETGRLVYNSENKEIARPADLSGKIYAGFGSAWEGALIETMIRSDGGDPVYDTVTLGTGAYEALAAGKVDFTLEVATWEGVNSELLGRKQSYFAYADYDVPDQHNGYIGTRAEVLQANPGMVETFMRVTQAGYDWAVEHPDEAANLLIAAGDFPAAELVQGSMEKIVEGAYMREGDTPVGKINEDRFTKMARFLFESNVLRDTDGNALQWPGEVSSWFDQEWMGE